MGILLKKKKYLKPIFIVELVELESTLSAESGKVLVTFGRDEDGIPYLEDPNVETKDNELFF